MITIERRLCFTFSPRHCGQEKEKGIVLCVKLLEAAEISKVSSMEVGSFF